MIKKIFLLFAVAMLVISTAFAQTTSGTCGDNATWEYNESSHTLTISGTGRMYDYYEGEYGYPPWKDIMGDVEYIVINDGITHISAGAFWRQVKNAIIPRSVTSIGENAFFDVANIEYYGNAEGSPWAAFCRNGYIEGDFVYSDNTKKEIRRYIGKGGDVAIPDGVTSIGNGACEYTRRCHYGKLTSITIPESVTTIDYMAFIGNDIKSVTIPKNVTSIGLEICSYNENLESIYLNNDPTKLEYVPDMCDRKIRYFVLPEYLDIWMEKNSKLTFTLNGEEYEQDGVIYNLCDNGTAAVIGYTSDLAAELIIPATITKDGTDYSIVTICNSSFADCKILTSVVIPEGVKSIGSNVFDYSTLTSAVIPGSVTSIGSHVFGVTFRELYCYADPDIINFHDMRYLSESTKFHIFIGDLDKWKEKYNNVKFTFVDDIKRLSDCSITIPAQPYTGKALMPVVNDGDKTLVEGEDYTITLPEGGCIDAGEYTVTLKGKNSLYYKSAEKAFVITPKALTSDGISVSEISSQTYTGSAIEPAITITDGNKTLAEGTDYTVEYADNINAGTAKVLITGKANYSGTIEKTFTIIGSPKTATDDITINSTVKIWGFEKTIFVENATKEIRIVDMSGRVIKAIKPDNNRMEIPISKSGIFIVKTGVKTLKVSL